MPGTLRLASRLLRTQWFLVLLAIALAVGFLASEPVRRMGQTPGLRSILVAGVLFLMGITLQPRAVRRSLQRPAACGLGLLLNTIAVPAFAFAAAQLLPPSLGAGLIVASAVPCTLASASVWTRKGGGNDAVSMLVTVVTNLLCFIVAPLTLTMLIGRSVDIDFSKQATSLAILVVLPIVCAQIIRLRPTIARRADKHKILLSTVAQFGILAMVAIGAAETMVSFASAETDSSGPLINIPLLSFVVTGLLALAVHGVVLVLGYRLAQRMGLPEEDSVAVAISGSQKTLMVGLQIALDCGVSMLPMILYHVGQLIIDTFWVQNRTPNAKID